MIITCPCEKKQFKIDSSLIPQEGRELQCGSCERVWFYKPKDESEAPLTLNENISEKKIEPAIETNDKKPEVRKNLQKKIIEPQIKNKTSKEIPNKVKKLENENKGSKFFSYLIVFIISIVALIILLDTLKTPLINVFPGLEIVLFNLFETLQDIKLFIIDLI